MEIGRRSLLSFGAVHFGMGLIRATFQADGNILLEMKLLRIWVSGEARWSATIFINLTGIPSGPQEQSERSFFSWRSTWPQDTGLRTKVPALLYL